MAIRPFVHYRRSDLIVQITYDDVTNQLVGVTASNNTGRTVRIHVDWVGSNHIALLGPGSFSAALPAGIQLIMIDGSLGLQGFTWEVRG